MFCENRLFFKYTVETGVDNTKVITKIFLATYKDSNKENNVGSRLSIFVFVKSTSEEPPKRTTVYEF